MTDRSLKTLWRDLRIPLLFILIAGTASMLFLPIMPIDETRYVSVAWEMQNSHSWLVPLLNGMPYDHKPPLLFWLIQAVWKCVGVQDAAPRLIPVGASLLSILLTYRISLRLWPDDRKAAAYGALILASTGIWLFWSAAIMFDILLTAWILLAVLGTLRLADTKRAGWLMLTLGIAGGFLTKGPIVLVYVLPITLTARFWASVLPKKWHLKTAAAVCCALGLALLWAVPAAVAGGDAYAKAILWGQAAGRITKSFDHCRPFWWYIPLIPVVLFPWSLLFFSLPKPRALFADKSVRLLLIWMGLSFLVLSLISGKQLHYLIPILPACALLAGHMAARAAVLKKTGFRLVGGVYVLAGLAGFVLPHLSLGSDVGQLSPGSTLPASIGLTAAGTLLLFLKFRSVSSGMNAVAMSTVLVLLATLCGVRHTLMEGYDIQGIACFIRTQVDAGRRVVHLATYHGQYQYLGRLTRPLEVVDGRREERQNFVVENPDAILISYKHEGETIPNATIFYTQKYRGKAVIAWSPAALADGKDPDENSAD